MNDPEKVFNFQIPTPSTEKLRRHEALSQAKPVQATMPASQIEFLAKEVRRREELRLSLQATGLTS